jgi:hypothetical protein
MYGSKQYSISKREIVGDPGFFGLLGQFLNLVPKNVIIPLGAGIAQSV